MPDRCSCPRPGVRRPTGQIARDPGVEAGQNLPGTDLQRGIHARFTQSRHTIGPPHRVSHLQGQELTRAGAGGGVVGGGVDAAAELDAAELALLLAAEDADDDAAELAAELAAEAAALRVQGFDFYDWGAVDENYGAARLVTSWQHTETDVAPLARAIAAL